MNPAGTRVWISGVGMTPFGVHSGGLESKGHPIARPDSGDCSNSLSSCEVP